MVNVSIICFTEKLFFLQHKLVVLNNIFQDIRIVRCAQPLYSPVLNFTKSPGRSGNIAFYHCFLVKPFTNSIGECVPGSNAKPTSTTSCSSSQLSAPKGQAYCNSYCLILALFNCLGHDVSPFTSLLIVTYYLVMP